MIHICKVMIAVARSIEVSFRWMLGMGTFVKQLH
jgi:hypothetical protein